MRFLNVLRIVAGDADRHVGQSRQFSRPARQRHRRQAEPTRDTNGLQDIGGIAAGTQHQQHVARFA